MEKTTVAGRWFPRGEILGFPGVEGKTSDHLFRNQRIDHGRAPTYNTRAASA